MGANFVTSAIGWLWANSFAIDAPQRLRMVNVVMNDLEKAVKEWCEARKAFFAVPPTSSDPKLRFPPEIWIRLGNAEHRLMQMGERL